MNVAAVLIGLFAFFSACVAFFPLLNALNYCVTLPLSLLGIVFSLVAISRQGEARALALLGLVLNLLALFIAGVRVVLSFWFGGGIF